MRQKSRKYADIQACPYILGYRAKRSNGGPWLMRCPLFIPHLAPSHAMRILPPALGSRVLSVGWIWGRDLHTSQKQSQSHFGREIQGPEYWRKVQQNGEGGSRTVMYHLPLPHILLPYREAGSWWMSSAGWATGLSAWDQGQYWAWRWMTPEFTEWPSLYG